MRSHGASPLPLPATHRILAPNCLGGGREGERAGANARQRIYQKAGAAE